MPCAIHALVQNVLSIGAASVVIYFANLFMIYPGLCFFSSSSGCSSSTSLTLSSASSTYQIKATLLKAQLACAAVMMFTSVVYIAIFTFIAIKANRRSKGQPPIEHLPVNTSQPVNFYSGDPNTYPYALHPPAPNFPSYVAECPNCHIYMRVG